MKSLLLTFFNTKAGLELLNDEFEDDLLRKSYLLFGISSLISSLMNVNEGSNRFVFSFIITLTSIVVSVLVWTLISYVLYKIGDRLKGKASFIEIISLVAYANFPIIICLLIVWCLRDVSLFQNDYNTPQIRNMISVFSYIFFLKIMFLGFLKFNQYSIKKAFINMTPIFTFIIIIFIWVDFIFGGIEKLYF